MSSDGDISVAEALQQLKKRARNEVEPIRHVRPAIHWPEPPLPKIRKEESSAPQLAPRILQAHLPRPQMPNSGMQAFRPTGPQIAAADFKSFGPSPAPYAGAGPALSPAVPGLRPPGLAGFGGGALQGNSAIPSVAFGPEMPPGASTAPALGVLAAQASLGQASVGPGKTQVSFEIAQSKVGLLLGKQGTTINAIKVYTKANCLVEQHTPDEEQARITIMGSPAEVEKCKQTINALVNGIMNSTMLFQLAGLPPPQDIPGAGLLGAPLGPTMTAPASMPSLPTPQMSPPSLPRPTMPALPAAGLGAGTTMPLGGSFGTPGFAMPGAPMPQYSMPAPQISQDMQIQEKLNDFYSQWWQHHATAQQTDVPGAVPQAGMDMDPGRPAAFDKEALARLAEQASKAAQEPAPAPAPAPAPVPVSRPGSLVAPVAPLPVQALAPPLQGDLTQRATQEVRQLLEGVTPMAPIAPPGEMAPGSGALPSRAAPLPDEQLAPFSAAIPPPAPFAAVPPPAFAEPLRSAPVAMQQAGMGTSLSGMLNGGFQIKPQTPQAPRANKDNDSVLKMLQTMQGNVIQAKIEKIEAIKAVPPPPPSQAIARIRGPAEALQGFEPVAPMQEMARVDPQLDALFQRIQGARPEALEAISRDVLTALQAFSPEQVVELLMKLETIPGFSRGELGAEVGRVVAPRLREFTGSQFSGIMCTFMTWLSNDPSKEAAEKTRGFYVSASTEMSSRLMEFAPQEINCCLASLISSSFSELRFFAQVGRAALARVSSFGVQQLTALLSLLSEVRLTHLDLFGAAAQFIVGRTKEMRKLDLLRLARAFAKCNIRCDPLCQAIGNEVMSRLKQGARTENSTFKVEELCEFSWICCCLGSYHEELFRAMFKQLEETVQVATDSLCLVHEIHLVLDSEHKEAYSRYRIDPEGAQALMEHYKENRKDARRCAAKLRTDVASVLKSLVEGTVSANHRTSTGLLVDVAALRKRTSTDGFIHVEIDSAMSVIRALDQEETSPSSLLVEGPVALRRRILEKHGLIIVTLRESEWKVLDDSREKRRHLRSQLSALSDVLE